MKKNTDPGRFEKQKKVMGAQVESWKPKDSLSHEHKEEVQAIFYKLVDLLVSSILNNNVDIFIFKFLQGDEKNQ